MEEMLEVSFVDYMEGRLTGIYKQNYPKQQQQSSLKYRTYFDTFYGTSRSLDNASSFFSSPYSNPFIMPYTRSEVYHHRHPSVRSNNPYSDQSYRGMKPSSSVLAPPQDLLSQMTTEYCREFARELARKAVSVATTTATTSQPNMQSSPIQGGLGYNPILDVQHKQQQQEDVFGYRFEICKDCLYTEPLKVSFGKDGTKDNNNNNSNNSNNNNNNNGPVDVVARIEQKHICDPKLVASNRKEVQTKKGSVKPMVDNLPKVASRMTQGWINSQNKRISLVAIKIPHENKVKIKNNDHENNYNSSADNAADNNYNNNNTIQPPQQETIVIPNPKNSKQQITFQYSQEKHINLSLISNETSKNHYAARAIKYGHTILTKEEMEDFLNMVQTSTFAIFEIKSSLTTTTASSSLQPLQHHHPQQQHESTGLYFLAILPYDDTLHSQSWLPNESNNNNNNNNNNNKSIQSNSANETFLSLWNRLANISNFTISMKSQRSSLSSS